MERGEEWMGRGELEGRERGSKGRERVMCELCGVRCEGAGGGVGRISVWGRFGGCRMEEELGRGRYGKVWGRGWVVEGMGVSALGEDGGEGEEFGEGKLERMGELLGFGEGSGKGGEWGEGVGGGE